MPCKHKILCTWKVLEFYQLVGSTVKAETLNTVVAETLSETFAHSCTNFTALNLKNKTKQQSLILHILTYLQVVFLLFNFTFMFPACTERRQMKATKMVLILTRLVWADKAQRPLYSTHPFITDVFFNRVESHFILDKGKDRLPRFNVVQLR